MTSLELCLLVNAGDLGTAFGKSGKKLFADLGVSHLSAAETNCDLETVTVFKELYSAAEFDIKVVIADTGGHAYLLDLDNMLVAASFLLALELLETVFAVIHYLAYGRSSGRGDLYKIETSLGGYVKRLLCGNNTELSAVFTDETDLFIMYLFVYLMGDVTDGQTPPFI